LLITTVNGCNFVSVLQLSPVCTWWYIQAS